MLSTCIMKYNEKDIDGLYDKPRLGSDLDKYNRKKNLTDIEKV